jgi:hypothetical protein
MIYYLIMIYKYPGLSIEAIALRLGISKGYAHVLLQQALRKLRKNPRLLLFIDQDGEPLQQSLVFPSRKSIHYPEGYLD